MSIGPHRNRPSGDNQHGIAPKHLIRLKAIDALDANCRLLIKYGFLAVVAYFGYRSIAVLSGEYTFADIGIRFLANVKIANSIGYVVGLGGLAYGRRQKKLKEDTIEQLAPRIKQLESQIDPHRSSSGLTERGRTRPEDAI